MSSRANRGRDLEEALAAQHEAYRLRGAARVRKLHPPVKQLGQHQLLTYRSGNPRTGPVRQSVAFPAVWEDEGPPDYLAVSGGVSMLLDAKDCAAARWPLSALEWHQADAFDDHVRHGHWAGVLLRMERRLFVLPWLRGPDDDDLRGRWVARAAGEAARGEASLTVADCLTIGAACRGYDWLPVALGFARVGR